MSGGSSGSDISSGRSQKVDALVWHRRLFRSASHYVVYPWTGHQPSRRAFHDSWPGPAPSCAKRGDSGHKVHNRLAHDCDSRKHALSQSMQRAPIRWHYFLSDVYQCRALSLRSRGTNRLYIRRNVRHLRTCLARDLGLTYGGALSYPTEMLCHLTYASNSSACRHATDLRLFVAHFGLHRT